MLKQALRGAIDQQKVVACKEKMNGLTARDVPNLQGKNDSIDFTGVIRSFAIFGRIGFEGFSLQRWQSEI